MKPSLDSAGSGPQGPIPRWFSLCFGVFLGLALVKFGNPPIMEKWVTAPTNAYEFALGSPWPISWAYGIIAVVALAGAIVANRKVTAPYWLLALPLLWFLWECAAALFTVNPGLTQPTLAHFFACVVCFYLGYFSLSGVPRLSLFWLGLICGFLVVLAVGWEQQFGGLEQTRQYFFLYLYPRMKEVPPEYLKKISSARIFSTLFYPNALAGAILLLLPVVLQVIWCARRGFTQGARLFLVGLVGAAGLACLFWSGSKGGWLLMLVLGLIWLVQLPFSRTLKRVILLTTLVLGLSGFFWKYAGFFQKGATSVSARFDYWNAAVKTAAANPIWGTGPGTFSLAYQKLKRPESEMARLAHNDYLQQGSDSGLPGLLLYIAFIGGVLGLVRPGWQPRQPGIGPVEERLGVPPLPASESRSDSLKNRPAAAASSATERTSKAAGVAEAFAGHPIWFCLWLGTLGWALQSLMEFGLYIPALAWPAFAFLGLLLAKRYQNHLEP